MTATCETCRWAIQALNFDPAMQCRRRPPLVTGGLHTPVETVWPHVAANDFCGEHQQKDKP